MNEIIEQWILSYVKQSGVAIVDSTTIKMAYPDTRRADTLGVVASGEKVQVTHPALLDAFCAQYNLTWHAEQTRAVVFKLNKEKQ